MLKSLQLCVEVIFFSIDVYPIRLIRKKELRLDLKQFQRFYPISHLEGAK